MTDLPADRSSARRALSILCRAGERAAIAALLAMTAFLAIQIVGRELLNAGFPWADELARFCNIGLVFLAAPLLLASGAHVRVDMFEKMLGGMPRRIQGLLVELFGLMFCGLFLWGAWLFMQRASRFTTPALGIPNVIYYAPAILGMVLLALVALARTWDALTGSAGETGEPRP